MEHNIFNSTIWKSKIDYPNKDKLIKIIEENYKKNPNQTPKGWGCILHSSFQKEKTISGDFEDSLLDEIEEKLKQFLKIYVKKINIRGDYIISDIWYNAYSKHQFQEPHTHGAHGAALFSGCYYLKFNKNIHHQTTFCNPNFDLDYSKLENNSYFCFTPDCEEDDVIIFPSFLKHGTKGISDLNTKDIRITISFNISNNSVCYEKSNKNIINYG